MKNNSFFNRTAYQKTCPHGLAWDSMPSKCEWPDKVQCGNRPVTERFTGGPNKPASGPPCSCIGGIKECYSAGIKIGIFM